MSADGSTKNTNQWPVIAVLGTVFGVGAFVALGGPAAIFESGQSGAPLPGLGPGQLQKFYEARKLFTHQFTVEEGLGPRFNGSSCYQCHGQPGAIGGEGQNPQNASLLRIASRVSDSPTYGKDLRGVIATLNKKDVQYFENHGGPVVGKYSVTAQFPKIFSADCKLDTIPVPADCEFKSQRYAPQVLGLGLVSAIDDEDLMDLEDAEVEENVDMAGRAVEYKDPLTAEGRVARFGLKNQDTTLLGIVTEMMNHGLGLTSPLQPDLGTVGGINDLPRCLLPLLPPEPNDLGRIQANLTYFLALTAPPPRGKITPDVEAGEKIFTKLQCAFCHRPELHTKEHVQVVDPSSPFPDLQYIEIKALEDKPVKAYSDLLLHNMGSSLADGIPQGKAQSGEWRTAPLWGLSSRKYLMHDGSKTNLADAILAHGGQGKPSRDAFKKLPEQEKRQLYAFLQSL